MKANDYEIEDQIKNLQDEVDRATSSISRLLNFSPIKHVDLL